MFTGIVTDIGSIMASEDRGDRHVTVRCGYDMAGVAIGASIACSGACMTVVAKGNDWFACDVSSESASKTASRMWDAGRRLNLERALKVGDELGGHIVVGHVDGIAHVIEVREEGGSHRVAFSLSGDLAPFIAPKGSVTVDGVSLTVNGVGSDRFDVNIIPHTWAVTTLAELVPGRAVNIEIDVLARYLKRMKDVLA